MISPPARTARARARAELTDEIKIVIDKNRFDPVMGSHKPEHCLIGLRYHRADNSVCYGLNYFACDDLDKALGRQVFNGWNRQLCDQQLRSDAQSGPKWYDIPRTRRSECGSQQHSYL